MSNEFNRTTETISPNPILMRCVKSEMVIDIFNSDIQNIEDVIRDYQTNENKDLLRYTVVLLCSSIDNYMHNIIKTKLISAFTGRRDIGSKFENFLISINSTKKIIDNSFSPSTIEEVLDEEIYERMSMVSMHSQKSIDENLKYITSIKKIWLKIALKFDEDHKEKFDFHKDTGKLQELFREIIIRRNKIVHETDRLPTTQSKRDIDIDTVQRYKEFIVVFILILHNILSEEDTFEEIN